jgi:hypothetical protein
MRDIYRAAAAACILIACGHAGEPTEPKQLVHDGMSVGELRRALGEPIAIDSTGTVYDAMRGMKYRTEKWQYEKRTVFIINDTVRSVNMRY